MLPVKRKATVITPEDVIQIKAIAETAKQIRIKTGLSYEGFAARHGIHRLTYYKFERGDQNFTIATLLKVIRGLGLTMPKFFILVDEPK